MLKDILEYVVMFYVVRPIPILVILIVAVGQIITYIIMLVINLYQTHTKRSIIQSYWRGEKMTEMTRKEIDEAMEKGENLYNLYELQKLTPAQIDRAIMIGERLCPLYIYQRLTPANIDRAMVKGEYLNYLYESQKLTLSQIDRAIDIGEDLGCLYERQKLTPSQIDRAMDKGEEVRYLYSRQKLTPSQIDRAIDKGVEVCYLYRHQMLTPSQIDRAIDKGEDVHYLYSSQTLTPAQIDWAMDRGKYLDNLYFRQTLTPSQIDRAMDKGEYLDDLYFRQTLTPSQIDRAMDKGEYLYAIYERQKLTLPQIDRAIDIGEDLGCLYESQKLTPLHIDRAIDKGEYLYAIYERQKLTLPQIDRAIDIGEDLGCLYESQKLTPLHIDRAIDKGEYLDILFSYQTLSPDQIQYAINNNIALEFLYMSPLTSKEQKKTILGKLGVLVTEEQMESPLWRGIVPTKLAEATEIFDKSIEEKIEERPIDDLVGVYPIEETPFDAIRLCLNKKKFYTKEGDIGYGYYTDKSGNERKIRIGKIIKDDPDLLKSYNRLKQVGLAEGKLEIVISNESEDIARKSTGQNWTTCETVGSDFGWPPKCGWCDDIKANNLIAYIREKDQDKWIGRTMIRWCIRDDDKSSDAVIENYYGNTKYAEILRNELIKILRAKGYSGIRGDVLCQTPYSFTGYLDSGSWSNHHIDYRVGDKPLLNLYQKVYHPKLVKR